MDDPDFPGKCPHCGGEYSTVQRCALCPAAEIDRQRSETLAGRLLEQTLELDFNTRRFSVPWDAVNVEQTKALQILEQERNRYERDRAKEAQLVAEQEQRVAQAKARQR